MTLIRFLCEHVGVDPNNRDETLVTPLHRAATFGQMEAVRYLVLEKEVDVNKKNNMGFTPFMDACTYNFVHIAEFLIKEGKCCTKWKEKKYSWEFIKHHNQCKITLMCTSSLLFAMEKGFDDLVTLFMENGVVKCKDIAWMILETFVKKDDDEDPEPERDPKREAVWDLDYFLTKGRMAINSKIKKNRIEIFNRSCTNTSGMLSSYKKDEKENIVTILDIATYLGDEEIVKKLLDHGAKLDTNRGCENAIHIAEHRGHNHIVKLLSTHFGYA